jgi:hypothetical protein
MKSFRVILADDQHNDPIPARIVGLVVHADNEEEALRVAQEFLPEALFLYASRS